jgi:sensor histidine kinase YesM
MIQKCRYNKRLTYDIHIDEEAKQCIVPKLIMQPIIENCINHSYKGKDTLHIDVNIKVVDDMLMMEIIDNGDGMSEEALDDLRRRLDDEQLVSNSIGLNNVNRRLKLLYGLDFGLMIKSELGIGTIVIIKMPKKVW